MTETSELPQLNESTAKRQIHPSILHLLSTPVQGCRGAGAPALLAWKQVVLYRISHFMAGKLFTSSNRTSVGIEPAIKQQGSGPLQIFVGQKEK